VKPEKRKAHLKTMRRYLITTLMCCLLVSASLLCLSLLSAPARADEIPVEGYVAPSVFPNPSPDADKIAEKVKESVPKVTSPTHTKSSVTDTTVRTGQDAEAVKLSLTALCVSALALICLFFLSRRDKRKERTVKESRHPQTHTSPKTGLVL
jgi:hypothetical protein